MSIYYTGLSAEQVAESRQKFGANVIHFPMQPSLTDKISWVNQSWQIRLLLGINFSILLFISFCRTQMHAILPKADSRAGCTGLPSGVQMFRNRQSLR